MDTPLNPNIPNPISLLGHAPVVAAHDYMHPSEFWPEQQCSEIPGFSDYLALNNGIIWSKKAGLPCHLHSDKDGGHMVKLTTEDGLTWIRVHILIATCFVLNDNVRHTHVAHRNRIRTDNRAENLYWVHRRELTKEMLAATAKLEKAPRISSPSRLGDDDVREIHRAAASGVSAFVLARTFGVGRATIYNILRGDTHRHIFNEFHNPNA